MIVAFIKVWYVQRLFFTELHDVFVERRAFGDKTGQPLSEE